MDCCASASSTCPTKKQICLVYTQRPHETLKYLLERESEHPPELLQNIDYPDWFLNPLSIQQMDLSFFCLSENQYCG